MWLVYIDRDKERREAVRRRGGFPLPRTQQECLECDHFEDVRENGEGWCAIRHQWRTFEPREGCGMRVE